MNELDTKSMESLAAWVGTLGNEVGRLATVLESQQLPRAERQVAARCLDYWNRSAHLEVEGIQELLLIDVALVFRTLADFAIVKPGEPESPGVPAEEEGSKPESDNVLGELSQGAATVRQLLGENYGSLARFASNLHEPVDADRDASAEEPTARNTLIEEARQWAESYEAPRQQVDENALIKVRAFVSNRYLEASTESQLSG